jgi:hypothetical protein
MTPRRKPHVQQQSLLDWKHLERPLEPIAYQHTLWERNLDRSQVGHATIDYCDHGYILIADPFAASTAIIGTFHAVKFTRVVTSRTWPLSTAQKRANAT